MDRYDVIVIGAGAAGMFCAIEAGRRGRRVLLLDHAKAMGEKIRISGGGRCNFTNLYVNSEKFISQNPYFARSALARYTQWDFLDRINAAGIPYHEKTLGQLFCDGSAKEIIAMLATDLEGAGVDVLLSTTIETVQQEIGFRVLTNKGLFASESCVIATGGKSIPKMGATGFGYKIAEQFGLDVLPTRAGLVPLTFGGSTLDRLRALAGVSTDAIVGCSDMSFQEGLLFTHRGLSGPSILQVSSYWKDGEPIFVNLTPDVDIFEALKSERGRKGRVQVVTALAEYVPKKIAQLCVGQAGIEGNLADQSDANLKTLAKVVRAWTVQPSGTEGYRTAEVTLGGVNTDELDAKTMESHKIPGLYFIGEVVDVTGWLGGYNFQWAWSSGWVAGQAA